jgi:hypothetical protein
VILVYLVFIPVFLENAFHAQDDRRMVMMLICIQAWKACNTRLPGLNANEHDFVLQRERRFLHDDREYYGSVFTLLHSSVLLKLL